MENNTSLQQQLLDAGVHFGHLKKKWNPKMLPYIFAEKKGIHIIDLNKTVDHLQEAAAAVKQIAKSGKKIMFVATKKQAKEIVSECAKRVNMPYATERWLGGMLTNFNTVRKSVKKMQSIEKMLADGSAESLTKKERLTLSRDRDKMEKVLGGIAQLGRLPAALFMVDIGHEHIALSEAKRLGIATFGMVDTNSDPNKVDFAIPANDDATKSIAIITNYITAAIAEGLAERQASKEEEESDETSNENEARARRLEAEAQSEAAVRGSCLMDSYGANARTGGDDRGFCAKSARAAWRPLYRLPPEERLPRRLSNYFEGTYTTASCLGLQVVQRGTNKGYRLDRWILAHQTEGPVLYQVEIKNWSAHAIGGKRLAREASSDELRSYKTERWLSMWTGTQFRTESVRKVLTPMRSPRPGVPIEALVCFWTALHPEGEETPLFSVPLPLHEHFQRVWVFSMSSYLRSVKQASLVLRMPEVAQRQAWLARLFPITS